MIDSKNLLAFASVFAISSVFAFADSSPTPYTYNSERYKNIASKEEAENIRELGTYAAKVEFDPGTTRLTKDSKEEISTLVNRARNNGKLEKIRVLSWADREYPQKGEKVARREITLAEDRNDSVKNFLSEQLNIRDVDTYNMARRPAAISRFLRTPETKIKNRAESIGIAPHYSESLSLYSERRRASSALILAVMDE